MGLFGLVKDIVLLPIEVAADVTGIGMIKKITIDNGDSGFLMTTDRLKSMAKNIEETYDK